MNEVVSFRGGNALANLKKAAGAVRQAVQSGTPVTAANYLKLGRDGIWAFGQAGVEPEDVPFAVNPASLKHGHVNWHEDEKKTEKLGEAMVSIYEHPVLPVMPTHIANGKWTEQWSCEMTCMDGEDKGTVMTYATNSKGGLGALRDKLAVAILDQMEADKDCVPLIRLDSDFYTHSAFGKTYFPVLEVLSWAGIDDEAPDVPETAEAAPEPEQKAPPKRQKRARRGK